VTDLQIFLVDALKLSIVEKERNSSVEYDEYISDPNHPVPYTATIHSTKTM
jgi:hypothetical protein